MHGCSATLLLNRLCLCLSAQVFEAVRAATPMFRAVSVNDPMEAPKNRISDIFWPTTRRYSGGTGSDSDLHNAGFFFIACGADVMNRDATAFSRLLAGSLRTEGFAVALGFKPSDDKEDKEYATRLQKRLQDCAMVIVVIENGHDQAFLSAIMQQTSALYVRLRCLVHASLCRACNVLQRRHVLRSNSVCTRHSHRTHMSVVYGWVVRTGERSAW